MNKSDFDTQQKRESITEIVKVLRSSYENNIITYDQYIRMTKDWDPSLKAALDHKEIDKAFYDSLVKKKEGPDLAPVGNLKARIQSGKQPFAPADAEPAQGGGGKRKKYSKGRSKYLKKRKKYSKKRSKYSKKRLKKRKSSKRR